MPPAVQYALRSKSTESYAHPTPGQSPVYRVEAARPFLTAEAAREYARTNRTSLGFADPLVVKVKRVELPPVLTEIGLHQVVSGDKYALKVSRAGRDRYGTEGLGHASDYIAQAQLFDTIPALLVVLQQMVHRTRSAGWTEQ